MDEKIFDSLMNMLYDLEDSAMAYLSGVDLWDIYSEHILNDNKVYGVLLQLCTISKIKDKIRRLQIKNKDLYDAILKNFEKEGKTE